MTPVTCYAGKRVALYGLAESGLVAALALTAGGAEVAAFDDDALNRTEARSRGIVTTDLGNESWSAFDALVVTPDIFPLDSEPHWVIDLARQTGTEIIGATELFCRERAKLCPHAPFIAIAGSRGKSTTAALVAHILRHAGLDVQISDRVGTPILALAPPAEERIHIAEMSESELALTPSFNIPPLVTKVSRHTYTVDHFGPTVGVLLNILDADRGAVAEPRNRRDLMSRVFKSATITIVNDGDNSGIGELLHGHHGFTYWFAHRNHLFDETDEFDPPDVIARSDKLFVCDPPFVVHRAEDGVPPEKLFDEMADLEGVAAFAGDHDKENAAAAACILQGLHIAWWPKNRSFMSAGAMFNDALAQAIRTFPGHR